MDMYRLRVPYRYFYQRCLGLTGRNYVEVMCAPGLPDRDLWLFTALVSGTDYTKTIRHVGKMTLLRCLVEPAWKALASKFVALDAISEEEGQRLYDAMHVIMKPNETKHTISNRDKLSAMRNMLYVLHLWKLQKPVITLDKYGYRIDGEGHVKCFEG